MMSKIGGPVLAVCGWSGSGKTTLLESIIPVLRGRGLSVALLKHDVHGFQLDVAGKDTDRLFRAGADVVIHSPDETMSRTHSADPVRPAAVITDLLREHDLVLVEGHKTTPLPKVWLASADDPAPPDTTEHVIETLPWDGERRDAFMRVLDTWLPGAWRSGPVFGGVLIGGGSRRMGTPKQCIEVGGMSFLERVVGAVGPHVERTLLLGAGDVPGACADLFLLPDPPDVRGPMAGILSALRWAPAATWIIAACDLPLVTGEACAWLLERRAPGRWAILPRTAGGHVEPLLALYDPRIRATLERSAAAGNIAPHRLGELACVATPTLPDAIADSWRNINSPEELEGLDL